MIVLDASAMVEALVGQSPDPALFDLLEGEIHAPHLLDVEVTSVLRGLELGRVISPETTARALDDHWSFTIHRHEAEALSPRVWALRHQFTAYDASYLALAEALEVPLVTCDRKLDARGHDAEVKVLARSR